MSYDECVELNSGQKLTIKADECGKATLDTRSSRCVQNIVGSTPYRASKGWMNLWKTKWKYKGEGNPKCALYGCSNVSEVGGHMQYKRQVNACVYIIPICRRCNNLSRKENEEGFSLHHDGVAGRAITQR